MKKFSAIVCLLLAVFNPTIFSQTSIASGKLYLTYNYVDMEVIQMFQNGDKAGIQALEQKSANGDPESLYRVGITLIYGELSQNPKAPNFGNGLGNISAAAQKGHVQSKYLVSLFYPLYTKKEDQQLALDYLKNAAEQGNYAATFQMGMEYMLGETVEKNRSEAIRYLQKSASMNNPNAQHYLADLIEPTDFSKAVSLYKQAAEGRSHQAMYRLGELYLDGKITGTPDFKTGQSWMNKAVNNGNQMALEWFEAQARGPKGTAEMNHFLITTKWYKNLKIQDQSQHYDFSKELSQLQKLAEERNLEAMYYLGQLYDEGMVFEEDFNQAMSWYKKAADAGHGVSMFKLGQIYEYRKEFEDPRKAFEHYKKAHELGNAAGTYKIGEFFKYGKGGYSENDTEALKWFTLSAERGYVAAMLEVGTTYLCGRSVAKNQSLSNIWLRKAADNGSEKAKNILSGAETNPCFDIRDINK